MTSQLNWILKLSGFAVLIAMAALQLRFSVIEQEIFAGNHGETDAIQSRNPKVLTNLANEKHLFEADLDGSATLLQQALIANPLYVPAWLALALVDNDRNEKQRSIAILDYTHHLTSGIKRWRWDIVLTAYQLGETNLLPVELSYIIAEIPGKSRKGALRLAFSQWPDPTELLNNIGPENLPHLYRYAIQNKDTEKTIYFQEELEKLDIDIERKDLLGAIEMLMRNDELTEAAAIWRREVNSDRLLFDGGFETPFMQKAFGWRRSKIPSVAVTVERAKLPPQADPNSRALHVRFKGWDNLNYHHFYQVVPLKPASYRLTGRVKSQKLSTDQRPYLEVYGYQCKDAQFKYEKTGMVPILTDWAPFELDFSVPAGCEAAIVRLRRNESHHIDNKISGHLWLAEMRLTETGTAAPPTE